MVRTIDLPEFADVDALTYNIATDGILTAQMPLHLPQKSEPPPGVVPIVTNNGRRSIRLQFRIGSEFTMDDVQVRLSVCMRPIGLGGPIVYVRYSLPIRPTAVAVMDV